MLGNDDSSVCAHDVLNMEYEGLLHYIHMRPQSLGEYVIYGYSFVPLTPFGIKDWDKFDTADQIPLPTGYPPFFTQENGTTVVDFDQDIRPRGTIEDDFKAIAAEEDSTKTLTSPTHRHTVRRWTSFTAARMWAAKRYAGLLKRRNRRSLSMVIFTNRRREAGKYSTALEIQCVSIPVRAWKY